MKTLYEHGQEDGAYDTIISLISKGRLTVKEGAEELGISEEDLQSKMAKGR